MSIINIRRRRRGAAGGGVVTPPPNAMDTTPHRYWRIFSTSNESTFTGNSPQGNTQIGEIELRETVGGPDITTGKTAIGSSQFSSEFPLAAAFNDNAASPWASAAGANGTHWIGIDLGSGGAKNVAQIVLTCRTNATSNDIGQTIRAGLLQWSDDGVTWTTKWGFLLNGWTGGLTQTAVAPPAESHRFWRVCVDMNANVGAVSATEVELRTAPGGPDVAAGGTPFAHGYFQNSATYHFNKAFDNDLTSMWVGSDNVRSGFIGYDFGLGNEKKIVEFSWKARIDQYANEAPLYGKLQWSDDYVTWSTAFLYETTANWSSGEVRVFGPPPVTTGKAYWRAYVTENYGDQYLTIGELAFYDSTGAKVSHTQNKLVIRDGQLDAGSHAAINAFDGSASSVWASASGAFPHWLGVQFTQARDIVRVDVTHRTDGYLTQGPKKGFIQYSEDGVTWINAWPFEFTAWTAGQTQTTHGGEMTATHWRIRTPAKDLVSLAELTMHTSPGSPNLVSGLTGASTFQSSAYQNNPGTYGISQAFDGNLSTLFHTDTTNQAHWFGASLGAPASVNHITMTPRTDGFTTQAPVGVCYVEYSLDNKATWVVAWEFNAGAYWEAGKTKRFTNYSRMNTEQVAKTHWRIAVTDTFGNHNYMVVADLQFRKTAGVNEVPTGGVPFTNSLLDDRVVENAFDGNAATSWAPQQSYHKTPNKAVLGYQFPVNQEAVQLMIQCANDATATAPRDFEVHYGDGVTWKRLASFAGVTWSSNSEIKTFALPTITGNEPIVDKTKRRWRIRSQGTGQLSLDKLKLRNAQWADLAEGKTGSDLIYDSTAGGSEGPEKAFDTITSQWTTTNSGLFHFLGADLGGDVEIKGVELTSRSEGDTFAPRGVFYVEWAPHNEDIWTIDWQFNVGQTAWSSRETRIFTKPGFTIPSASDDGYRYHRFRFSAVQGPNANNHVGVGELEAFEAGSSTNLFTDSTKMVASSTIDNRTDVNGPKAADANTTTGWFSGNASGGIEHLQYDFGSGVKKKITSFRLTQYPANAINNPVAGKVLGSNDGTNWTLLWDWTFPSDWPLSSGATKTSVKPELVASSIWRVRATAVQNSNVSFTLARLQMRTANGGPDVAGALGTAFASSEYTAGGKDLVWDTDVSSGWASTSVANAFIGRDLGDGNERTIVEVAISSWAGSQGAQQSITEGFVERWDPSLGWVPEFRISTPGNWTAGVSQTRVFSRYDAGARDNLPAPSGAYGTYPVSDVRPTLWLDPSEDATRFQLSTKTTPAGVGNPVGFLADRSMWQRNFTQTGAVNRPTVGQANGLESLELGTNANPGDGADWLSHAGGMTPGTQDLFFVVERGQANAILLHIGDSSNTFLGVASAGGSGVLDSNAGAISYFKNGVALSPATRDGLATAMPLNTKVLISCRGANLGVWTAFFLGGYLGASFAGISRYHEVVAFPTLSTAKYNEVLAQLMTKHGLT